MQFEDLKRDCPSNKTKFVHFPSLINECICSGKARVPELSREKEYILFFGSVDFYKGVDLLIEAFRKLKSNKQKLVIAGKGDCNGFVNKNIIRLNRYIRDDEINDLFSNASVVVYPYRNATMSGVFSLAMYYSKRIIASDIPFFLQYTDKSVSFFKNGDVSSLFHILEKVLSLENNNNSSYCMFFSQTMLKKEMECFYLE